jgi:hypothetical protein
MDTKWEVEEYVYIYEITHEETNRKWRYEDEENSLLPNVLTVERPADLQNSWIHLSIETVETNNIITL